MKRRAMKLFALAVLSASWAVSAVPATAGAAGCPNEIFRGGLSALLPECRAYEKVSPDEKANGDVETRLGFAQSRGAAGLDEDGYAFLSYNGLPGSEGGALQTGNVARRGGDGWISSPFSPSIVNETTIPMVSSSLLISQDLNKVLVESQKPLTPDAQPGPNLYVRTISPPSVQLITPMPIPIVIGNGYTVTAVNIYGASNDFSHIVFQNRAKLTPDSPALPPSGQGMNLYEWNGSTLKNIDILPGQTQPDSRGVGVSNATGAVSPDGQRVIFRAPEGGPYVLRDHGTPIYLGTCVQGKCAYAASRDLSTIFTATGGDLYRYDVEAGEMVDLTAGAAGGGSAEVNAVNLLAAPDGDAVFFVAKAAMAPGATAGAPNLYRWSAGDGIEFVARLNPSDPFVAAQNVNAQSMEASISDAGDAVAFTSVGALTGESPAGVREIYHWSKAEGLTCASCNAGLASPAGYPVPPTQILGGAGATILSSPSPLSADGKKVFFSTVDRLLPQDTNGKMDAYEWVGGTVHLISTGTGDYGAEFLDASPSAKDIFFVTRDRLVAADRDENTDVYDAREGGGFAEPAPAVPCEAEACRPPLEAAPAAPQVGSRSFSGPPNQKPKSSAKKKQKPKQQKKQHQKKKKQQKKSKQCKGKSKAKSKANKCSQKSHKARSTGKRG